MRIGSPQFNTSVPHKRATPFQPPESLSSTPKNLQFHTKDPSVPHPPSSTHLSHKNCVKLRVFLCGTEAGTELRDTQCKSLWYFLKSLVICCLNVGKFLDESQYALKQQFLILYSFMHEFYSFIHGPRKIFSELL